MSGVFIGFFRNGTFTAEADLVHSKFCSRCQCFELKRCVFFAACRRGLGFRCDYEIDSSHILLWGRGWVPVPFNARRHRVPFLSFYDTSSDYGH